MQKKTKIALAAGAVALALAAGIAGMAQAQMTGMSWRHHGMEGGPMGMHAMVMNFMERYDANKDGKIGQDEIDQNRTAWFNEFDTAKKGTLTLEQFQNLWLKEHHTQMVRAFQFLDHNGDSQVTLDEYKQPMANLVADLDRNNDGTLGRDDRPVGPPAMGAGFRHHMGMMGDDGDDRGTGPGEPGDGGQ